MFNQDGGAAGCLAVWDGAGLTCCVLLAVVCLSPLLLLVLQLVLSLVLLKTVVLTGNL